MTYSVKEIFYTLQGEGINAGRPAVFCRFAGCNLWSGREEDRSTAVCQFCDTDFVGTNGTLGGKYLTSSHLAERISSLWPIRSRCNTFVVLTGGEPLLQVDGELIRALHSNSCTVAIETNGTLLAPEEIDWICVSPKAGTALVQCTGNELKLVFPQTSLRPEEFEHYNFQHFVLQPMDGPNRRFNTEMAIDYCQRNPRWRLSLQTHKYLSIR